MYEVQYLNDEDFNPPKWCNWYSTRFDTAEVAIERRDLVREHSNHKPEHIRAVEVIYREI